MTGSRGLYKAGDLVLFYDTTSLNPVDFKPRPAFVLGFDAKEHKINLLPVTTKRGRTEEEGYSLKGEEVRAPKEMKHLENGKEVSLKGVIKTNNILQVNREQVTTMLDVFPLTCQEEVLDCYESFKDKEWYKEHLESYSTKHERVYRQFKESLVAEKLGFFLLDESTESSYDFNKNLELDLKGIQKVGNKDGVEGTLYSVILASSEEQEFEYTLLTEKNDRQIVRDWKRSKTARDWLLEDKEYHVLMRNIDIPIRPNPEPNQRYYSLNKFEKKYISEREIIY